MLETIRRYWIGILVLALVMLHASIVGMIRYQASLAKKDISCEVELGEFIAFRTKSEAPIQMSLHAVVPLKHRMQSRQLIELNQAQVRQALEEHLRQFDGRLLADPYLTDLRSQLLDILTQTLGATSVEDVIVTKIRPSNGESNFEFLSNASRPGPRKLVASLRGDTTSEDPEEVAPAEEVDHSPSDTEGAHAAEATEQHPITHKAPPAHGKAPKSSDRPKSSGKH
jgi:hypothetical protein